MAISASDAAISLAVEKDCFSSFAMTLLPNFQTACLIIGQFELAYALFMFAIPDRFKNDFVQ